MKNNNQVVYDTATRNKNVKQQPKVVKEKSEKVVVKTPKKAKVSAPKKASKTKSVSKKQHCEINRNTIKKHRT